MIIWDGFKNKPHTENNRFLKNMITCGNTEILFFTQTHVLAGRV